MGTKLSPTPPPATTDYIRRPSHSTSSASMELSLTAGPRFIMLFIMLELACMRTFCWATS